ncbi:MAG TPA: hypothetical protein EYM57_03335 [Gammaproteobacteria bacterium]|nr:hypothetical protein [Gammaproteobacteria bacterium]
MVQSLLVRLDDPALIDLSVIPWAAPVISFGDLSKARVATLGLNPSNREFVDVSNRELMGSERRFQTLNSLGLSKWSQAKPEHIDQIVDACFGYFDGNPYDGWFRALEKLFLDAGVSYYGMFSDACHLDLVPFATSTKWGALTTRQKAQLLSLSGDALGLLLRDSSIEVLVLNGQAVIDNLQQVSNRSFKKEVVAEWILPRRSSDGVLGYAYTGKINQVGGVDLGREVSVLGYNHNIQSSFGVTSQVKMAIQKWISHHTNEVFC